MKAHIISIGDELLIGQTINTNASFIGEILTKNQIEVSRVITVGDSGLTIKNAMSESADVADLVIITGGLGPTHDDITKNCIAEYFDTELVLDEETLENVKEVFRKRGLELTLNNEHQAYIPKIAEKIPNYNGIAPGFWIDKNDKIFVVLPGVPGEMKAMMEIFVIPIN